MREISFRDQFIECKNNGNREDIDISILKLKMLPGLLSGVKDLMDVETITICKKYKSACHSGLCKKERGL